MAFLVRICGASISVAPISTVAAASIAATAAAFPVLLHDGILKILVLQMNLGEAVVHILHGVKGTSQGIHQMVCENTFIDVGTELHQPHSSPCHSPDNLAFKGTFLHNSHLFEYLPVRTHTRQDHFIR